MASRAEMINKLGLSIDIVNPILDQAYKNEEKQIWENDLFSSPHGSHWHTSFHASEFPGDEDTACARKAMYGFMNIPAPEPINRSGRAVMEAGLDIEDRIVKRFERAGILLSEPPEAKHQTGFTEEKVWLSGSSDAIIKPPRINRPYVVEIKSKYQRVLDEMLTGDKGPDDQHINQVMTYISLVNKYGKEYWPDLDECIGGSLLYVSRDNPSITKEFKFQFDKEWWESGTKRLEDWKQYFLDGILPEKPENFMWSKGPCKYCKFKKHGCKPDFQNDVTELSKSNSIDWAEKLRPDYDYEETRNAVLARWIKEDNEV
jgi:hypothetical protein